jgi:hypothetical protein
MIKSLSLCLAMTAWVVGCGSASTVSDPDASLDEPSEGELGLLGQGGGGGKPQGKCPSGFTNCRGKCYVLSADTNNCGACGVVCPESWSCCNGACKSPEALQGDRANCGACGNDCGTGNLCCDGVCEVETANNCGTCGHSCLGGACCAGTCKCGSSCSTGTVCGRNSFCSSGTCACGADERMCDNGDCIVCGGYKVHDPQACACNCPLTSSSCGTGQTFDASNCTCVCDSPGTTISCGALCCDLATQFCSFSSSAFSSAQCVAR